MKKKSIFISIVLALVMCLASLVACGENVDNAGGGRPLSPGKPRLNLRRNLRRNPRRSLRLLMTLLRYSKSCKARSRWTRRCTPRR